MSTTDGYTDELLFKKTSEGDEQAFAVLFHRYMPRLLPFASKLTRNPSLTEHIVQETFLRLWLSRERLPEVENPSAWIYRIAANECFRALQHQAKLTQSAAPNEETDPLYETIQLRELSGLIKAAVETLPHQRRKIYSLSRDSGMTIPQIATQLGLSPHTVKNTLVASLKVIRAFLEKRGYSLPAVLLFWIGRR